MYILWKIMSPGMKMLFGTPAACEMRTPFLKVIYFGIIHWVLIGYIMYCILAFTGWKAIIVTIFINRYKGLAVLILQRLQMGKISLHYFNLVVYRFIL